MLSYTISYRGETKMENQVLVISRLHLSEETKGIQSQLEGLSIGESIESEGKKYTKVETDACNVEYSDNWKAYDFKDKPVGSYVKEITAEEVESVIVNALEGGSTYWLGLNNSTEIWKKKPQGIPLSLWATQMLLEGETLHFYDLEDEEEEWTLTLEQLMKGFKLNAEQRPFDSNVLDGDADTADCILQYGIFGELVYG